MGLKTHELRSLIGMDLNKSFQEDCGYIIGFGGKRYTLWSYSIRHNKAGERVGIDVFYNHNLGENIEKVGMQYPGVPVCMDLKGTEFHWSAPSQLSRPVRTEKSCDELINIPFGKFKGTAISDVHDAGYWAYLANTTDADDAFTTEDGIYHLKPLFEKRAQEEGCVKVNGWWYDENDEKEWVREALAISRHIENGEPFSFVPNFNGNEFRSGAINIYFKPEDTYEFFTYYGGGRFLVVTDKKGNRKNKRTKGKTITINDYTTTRNENGIIISILVNSFDLK